jgi:cellulose synthase (UDP-forming)
MDPEDPRGVGGSGDVSWPVAWARGGVAAESRARQATIRVAAVTGLAVTLLYLVWRTTSTLRGATWWLAVPLLGLELHALISLAFYTFDLWDVRPPRPPRGAVGTPSVAILIPTYNEPREVLLPTIAAATALQPAHQTWVLDDGERPWVADLAARLGARYRTRPGREHAKAGNLNAALPELDVELIAIFDADHIADATFFTRTLPHFADPRVALVQTPQDFYNVDSFEHVVGRRGRRFGEQELFYRALAAGRNRWNAAFWCGTNAVVRLAALREIGGIATDSITEDIHTTIRLHRRGWRTVYLNEVLAHGLAAGNIEQYLTQRLRWGTGAMQVLRAENPAVVSGLTVGQRVSYLSTLLGWFDSWRMLGYLLFPLLTVLTGALPIAANLRTFLPWFLGAFLAQRLALRMLSRGYAAAWYATVFEVIRLPANLRATLALAGRRQRGFAVTTKGRSGQARTRMPVPRLLTALVTAHLIALGWYVATALHHTPLHYRVAWTAHGAAFWMAINTALLLTAIRRIRSPRFAAERRASVRFPVEGEAIIDGIPGKLQDLSLTGAALAVRPGQLVVGQYVSLAFTTNGSAFDLPAVVRSVTGRLWPDNPPRPGSPGWAQAGLDFGDLPEEDAAKLAFELFRTGITPALQYA